MPSGEYERYRQQLDAQLHADVELIYEAYRAKLRAYETVARARGEEFAPLPAADLPIRLPPAPAPVPPTRPAAVALPISPAPRKAALQVEEAIVTALDTLPEVFDKRDLARAIGFEPRRSTLHRTLQRLIRDGELEIAAYGASRIPTSYRKAAGST
jgi:hypothetical protein